MGSKKSDGDQMKLLFLLLLFLSSLGFSAEAWMEPMVNDPDIIVIYQVINVQIITITEDWNTQKSTTETDMKSMQLKEYIRMHGKLKPEDIQTFHKHGFFVLVIYVSTV
jgi:hypothetical protein